MAQGLTRQQLEMMGATRNGAAPQQNKAQQPIDGNDRGFFGNMFKRPLERLVLEPGRRFGETVGAAITAPFISEEQKQRQTDAIRSDKSIDVPFLGEFQTRGLGKEDVGKQIVGETLETASWLIPPAKAGKVVTAGFRGIGQGAATGFVTGSSSGFLYGAGESLQEGSDIGTAIGEGARDGITGGLFGGALGAAAASVPVFRQNRIRKTSEQADRLSQSIHKGKVKDLDVIQRRIRDIDVDGIQNYDDLIKAYNDKVSVLSQKVDMITDAQPSPMPLKMWINKTKVGNKTIKQNPLSDALDHLQEVYSKTNQPVQAERIAQLKTTANSIGITPTEANRIAREYGLEFGQNAFSKIGEPLTSVNARNFENTRKSLKKSISEVVDSDLFNATDDVISDFIRLRKLSKNVNEKVNQLRGRTTKRGLGEQAGRALFRLIDTLTFKGAGGFLRAIVPSNMGVKTMNALDLEKNLGKNIAQLQKILDATDDKTMLDGINRMLRNIAN